MAESKMKLEHAARQALVALEDVMADFDGSWALADTAITALREALAEPDIEEMTLTQIAARHEQAEQEPVIKIHKYNEFQTLGSLNLPIGTKLYAAPVRTKDLTDDEIVKVTGCEKDRPLWLTVSSIARAVIVADREKNK